VHFRVLESADVPASIFKNHLSMHFLTTRELAEEFFVVTQELSLFFWSQRSVFLWSQPSDHQFNYYSGQQFTFLVVYELSCAMRETILHLTDVNLIIIVY
jgi:hypothetical protein